MSILLSLVVNAAALLAAAWIVPGIHLSTRFIDVVIVAAIFGLINALVKPLFTFLAFPLVILTLGLFTLVVNATILLLTGALTSRIVVDGFWPAFWGGIIISIVSVLMAGLTGRD